MTEGRDVVTGRFAEGNKGGPGRLPTKAASIRELQQTIEQAIRTRIGADKMLAMVEKVVRIATSTKSSDKDAIAATKVLLPYFLAKPTLETETAQEGQTYIFKIENATFAAKNKIDTTGEIIDATIVEHPKLEGNNERGNAESGKSD